MLKKLIFLLLVAVTLYAIMYAFNRNEKNDLQSQWNPSLRVIEDPVKKHEIKYIENEIIDEFIDKMTLDEKICQLIMTGINDKVMTEETKMLISQYQVGGIILFANNLETVDQSIQLLNQIKLENEKNIVPLFLGVDQEGGRVERLPEMMGLPTNEEIGTKNNEQFSFEIGELLGKQLKAFGFNLNFAPVLDVNSNPHNPVIGDRSFGNSPEMVGKLGVQTIDGMKTQQIIPVVNIFLDMEIQNSIPIWSCQL